MHHYGLTTSKKDWCDHALEEVWAFSEPAPLELVVSGLIVKWQEIDIINDYNRFMLKHMAYLYE